MLKHINAIIGIAASNEISFPEYLERIEQGQHRDCEQRRQQIGQRDLYKPFYAARPVYLCRLIQRRIDSTDP